MRRYFFIVLVMFSSLLHAEEKENSELILGLMATAKATGMCGVFSQMVNFQKTTKMPGGDDFIVRFLNTEAARLGYTLDSFMEKCPIVVKKYNDTVRLLASKQ